MLKQNTSIIAGAVLKQVTASQIIEALTNRVAAAAEAEWTGKFLPELRKTIRADVQAELHGGG